MSKEDPFDALVSLLAEIARYETGPRFCGRPDRWWDKFTVRCTSGHVSTGVLKTDRGDRCIACQEPVRLTFPEDVDDPDCDERGERT